jgi:polyisoprenoid-binding protein YceI
MKPFRSIALAFAMLAAGASLASAEATSWKFDPAHSEAGFTIRHFFSNVQGRFNTMNGSLVFDDKDWSKSSVEAVIDASSIFTNNERRDAHLRTSDFFDTANNPTITFRSTKVTKGEGNNFKIEGNLTMRGVTKPVVLDASYLGQGAVGQMGTKAGFTATTKLNRQDYGVKWNKALDNGGMMLDDVVTITLNIEANQVAPESAQAQPAGAGK